MGLPMSQLVAKAGYAVTAFDQSAARLNEAREQGIGVASFARRGRQRPRRGDHIAPR